MLRLEKVVGNWKLVGLEAIYDRDSINPIVPSKLGTNGASFKHQGREHYSGLTWFLEQRELPVNNDLAGTDKPQLMEALIARQFDWLNKSLSSFDKAFEFTMRNILWGNLSGN